MELTLLQEHNAGEATVVEVPQEHRRHTALEVPEEQW